MSDVYLDVNNPDWELNSPAGLELLKTTKPKVVCLCGSTKFKDEFIKQNFEFTRRNIIVLTVGWFAHSDDTYKPSETEKEFLDELHKRKIDLADFIFVINKGGYIGSSTQSEIEYALSIGKEVKYLE